MMLTVLDRYRPEGTRNWIRCGDTVAVDPPGKTRRFLAVIREIRADDTGLPVEVDVRVASKLNGDPHPQRGFLRCFTPAQISRVAQTRHTPRSKP